MAGLPAGTDTFFSVDPARLAKPESFAVKRGKVVGRLDTWFNHPRYELLRARLDASIVKTTELDGFLWSIAGGATPKLSDASLYTDSGIKFLRILNVEDGEIIEQDIKYITDAVHQEELGRSQLEAGDVLITITGRVGSAAVIREEHLPANINQHIARLRIDLKRCRPEFLSEWLNCPAGQQLSNRSVSGGTRPALDYGAVRSILVPLPDTLEAQDKLLVAMDASRAKRKAKLAEAIALLASLDDFVLDALGIAPPEKDSRRAFAVTLGQSRTQGQLNADFYHPERIRTLDELNNAGMHTELTPLAKVVNFERAQIKSPDENYLSLAHVESHTGELTDSQDKASGNAFMFQVDDVLFARLRPYLNKVYHAEMNGTCSTEFHVLRVKDRNTLLPEYLSTILRSRLILAQTVHMMTGNTHPRLVNAHVESLRIPIPKVNVQKTIAVDVAVRREEARRLRAEAEAGWQEAKRWFEEQLLGADSP